MNKKRVAMVGTIIGDAHCGALRSAMACHKGKLEPHNLSPEAQRLYDNTMDIKNIVQIRMPQGGGSKVIESVVRSSVQSLNWPYTNKYVVIVDFLQCDEPWAVVMYAYDDNYVGVAEVRLDPEKWELEF